jgi:hypothetical protein
MRFVKDHFDEYRESTIGGKYKYHIIFSRSSRIFFFSFFFFAPAYSKDKGQRGYKSFVVQKGEEQR